MKCIRTAATIALLSAFTLSVNADGGKTREQVRLELAEAVRNGDIAVGESNQTLRERSPHSYPAAPKIIGKTRAEVTAELAEAIRNGEISRGESSLTLREQFPHLYPPAGYLVGRTRDDVKAELAEAIRIGDISVGESSLKLNELYPQRYAKARTPADESIRQAAMPANATMP